MDNVLAARALMGVSLGFHIIYATIGIGLPFMLMLAEGLAIRTGDESYHQLARRWIRPAGLLFAIGAVSGTILSFELGLLWPRFMETSGPLIGLAFSIEGFAFFTEAIFLALYIYGEQRLSRRMLFLCTIPLSVSAAASAAFVISANAWMNTPTGFRRVNGVFTDIDPFGALANPAWAHQAIHGTLAAYVATGFAMSGVYALAMLRGRKSEDNKRAMKLSLAVAGVCLPLMFLSGDFAAVFLAKYEKPKLAAMEALFHTTQGAPLIVGGWPDPATGRVLYGIELPKLLSLLAHHDINSVVEGLDAFPPGTTPDPRLVHPFFDLMVGSFFIMAGVSAAFWWLIWKKKESAAGGWMLRGILVASPFGLIALESGWLVTEFGRQPWVITGHMRVTEGVTTNPGMGLVFLVFLLVYIVLTAGLLKMLLWPSSGKKEVRAAQEGQNVDP
ncbi:cytochrome ubiquinol oxidase subunit I [Pelotalea chapellei]|uniref:Cytochrome ubiquinol oxidase subunit I n=1 Tax=Pelotalea chapellei TaxID=44671 RepID=A0ABS5U6Y9_9BACT|nr:cytochrome ubiquinol oxidase subunit I [Pelotalea chapellei]MBT1071419.1 cytochrome ubiquinol oxidase subunit I [Pelotalea chapellei]